MFPEVRKYERLQLEGLGQNSQKAIRCRRMLGLKDEVSERSVENDPDDDEMEEEIKCFVEKFHELYGPRFLWLLPFNEYGLPKYISQTIRPSLLPYPEINTFKKYAKFVATFCSYEPSPEDQYPEILASPHACLHFRIGDAFDFSVFLCSLLLGSGYDAFVCTGYAPKEVALRDQTNVVNRVLIKKIQKIHRKFGSFSDDFDEVHDFSHLRQPISKKNQSLFHFLTRLDKFLIECENETSGKSSSETRLHAFVWVRPSWRDEKLMDDVFLEATTGFYYTRSSAPYLKIDLIFNECHSYVNMQERNFHEMSLNLNNSRLFLKVIEREAGVPWCSRLILPRPRFQQFCYEGEVTSTFYRCHVQEYTAGDQEDGIVRRVTLYSDRNLVEVEEICEKFQYRFDKLKFRLRFPRDNALCEYYDEPKRLRVYVSIPGLVEVFRFGDRLDYVSEFSRRGDDIKIKFKGRMDRLEKMSFSKKSLTEFYSRDEEKLAEHDVARIVFCGNEIEVLFHFAKHSIERGFLKFCRKNEVLEILESSDGLDQWTEDDITNLILEEKRARELLKNVTESVENDLKQKLEDERLLTKTRQENIGRQAKKFLKKSIYEEARDRAQTLEFLNPEEKVPEPDDFLSPYLKNKRFSAQECDDIKTKFKTKTIEQAKVLQVQLEKEHQILKKRGRRGDERDSMARISALEQKLGKHEIESIRKYKELEKTIAQDSRLSTLEN